MRKSLIVLWILLAVGRWQAEGQMVYGVNRDSLKRLVALSPEDGSRVALLITLGQQYEGNEPDSAIYFYQQAGKLSIRLSDHAGYIRYVSNYTAVLNVLGKFDESLQLNLQAVDTCVRYHLDQMSFMRALINTGNAYEQMNQHDSSAVYYIKALPLVEASGDSYALMTLYNNLSGLYRSLHQLNKSRDYSFQALRLAEKSHDDLSTAMACINLGNTLKDMDSIEAGAGYIQRAYLISVQQKDSAMMETALIDIGDTYLRLGQPEKYIPVYERALTLARNIHDVPSEAFAQQGLAFGLFWTGRYKEAEVLLNKAIPFARDNDQKEVWRSLLLLMSDVQAILGHMKAYKEYRDLSDSVSNTIMNESLVKNIQELETKYEVEKKKHDLLKKDLLLAEKDRLAVRQRTWLIATAAGIVLLALLFALTWRISRQQQQLDRRTIQALETEQENVRLKARLEGQYNERQRISQEMHDDMGSGLTSLLFLSRSIQGQDATVLRLRQTAERLIEKMNEIVWIMNHEQDSLDRLIAYMRLHIADVFDSAGLEYQFEVTEQLPAVTLTQEFRRNIYLSAKEAVHNIVKHAGASRVDIIITVTSHLQVIVADNGHGFHQSKRASFGNGLRNMQRRMEQLGGSFEISFIARGTKVVLSAPLPI